MRLKISISNDRYSVSSVYVGKSPLIFLSYAQKVGGTVPSPKSGGRPTHNFRKLRLWFLQAQSPRCANEHQESCYIQGVPKKTDPLICFCNNFGKCTPILILFSLLQQENYGSQNLSYFNHLTFIMLPLYLAKQTLMLYQCHYYVIIA